MQKEKSRSKAGRKPAGPFAHNSAQLTIRMPDELRARLEKSATKKGWSLTQELLARLESSYRQEQNEEDRLPVMRAIRYLIDQIAGRVNTYGRSDWRRSPFAFRVFRLAVNQLLEALEPPGDVQNPYEPPPHGSYFGTLADGVAASSFTAPEPLADHAVKVVMDSLLHAPGIKAALLQAALLQDLRARRGLEERLAALADTYDESDARRDLEIGEPPGGAP
jgi:hypothetical protein